MIELPHLGEQQIVDAGRVKTKRLGVFFVQFAPTFKQAAVDQNSAVATSRGRPSRAALSRQTRQHGTGSPSFCVGRHRFLKRICLDGCRAIALSYAREIWLGSRTWRASFRRRAGGRSLEHHGDDRGSRQLP